MLGLGSTHRKTIAMSIGWWYMRRLIRKRGAAALAGFVAGEGLSFARRPRERHSLRWLFFLGLIVGGALYWWRRQQGEGDDWGDWTPVPPTAPVRAEPAPLPEPMPVPGPVPT